MKKLICGLSFLWALASAVGTAQAEVAAQAEVTEREPLHTFFGKNQDVSAFVCAARRRECAVVVGGQTYSQVISAVIGYDKQGVLVLLELQDDEQVYIQITGPSSFVFHGKSKVSKWKTGE